MLIGTENNFDLIRFIIMLLQQGFVNVSVRQVDSGVLKREVCWMSTDRQAG